MAVSYSGLDVLCANASETQSGQTQTLQTDTDESGTPGEDGTEGDGAGDSEGEGDDGSDNEDQPGEDGDDGSDGEDLTDDTSDDGTGEENPEDGQDTEGDTAADEEDGEDIAPEDENSEDDEETEEEILTEEGMDEEEVPDGEDDPQTGRALGLYLDEFYDDDSYVDQQAVYNGSVQMTQLDTNGTYYHNERFSGYEIKKGIDVSVHNGVIDWTAVKAAGIEFAFIRVAFRGYGSTGSLNTDSRYTTNIAAAKAAGIKVGVYIFSQAISTAEAAEEANYAISHLGGYSLDLPIVMDYEFASTSSGDTGRLFKAVQAGTLNRDSMTQICNTFCTTVRNAGYKAALYGNKYMFSTYVNADKVAANNNQIWLANYTSKTSYTGTYTYWQCSSTEHVNGISTNVDLDFWYVGPKTNTVKYNGNGATSGSVKKQTGLKAEQSVTLRKNGYTRKGYRFTGWNTQANGLGTHYDEAQSFAFPAESYGKTLTLYAEWQIIPYTITYDLNYTGAVDTTGNPTSYNVATSTIKLKNPVRTGYTFKGWYTSKKWTTKVTKIKKGSTKNKKLYAKWSLNKYKIVYYGNGANSGSVSSQTCKFGKTYSIRTNKFKKKGYSFAGWATSKNSQTVVYNPGDKVTSLRDKNGATVKLYAVWIPKNYTITYVMGYEPEPAEEGQEQQPVDIGGNPTSYTIETATITLQTPTREGYVFKGWYTDAKFKKKITKIKKGSTGSKKIYAKWVQE